MERKRHGNNSKRDNFAERQYWKWEWLRRNKEYRKDFEKFGEGLQNAWKQYNEVARKVIDETGEPPDWHLPDPPYDIICLEMGTKWGMRELPDPYNSPQEAPRIAAYMPSLLGVFYDDLSSLSEMGSVLEEPNPRFKSKENFAGWTIWHTDDKSEFPKTSPLTSENCPHYLMIVARVDPWIQKTRLIEAINQCAKKNLDKLLKAQRSVFDKKSLRPRFDEFETYKNVYDLRDKGKSWRKIAKETLPNEEEPDVAMRRVRYHYDQAKWWINEGWRVL
jgi:hypothetical protein